MNHKEKEVSYHLLKEENHKIKLNFKAKQTIHQIKERSQTVLVQAFYKNCKQICNSQSQKKIKHKIKPIKRMKNS